MDYTINKIHRITQATSRSRQEGRRRGARSSSDAAQALRSSSFPPTIAAGSSKGISTIDEVFPGRPRRAMAATEGVLARGSGLERRADYSVFYGQ
jgi:hypothetical protein